MSVLALIFRALLLVYPLLDNEPEINEVIYLPDFDIETTELVEAKELERISFEYIHDQIIIESICLFILESKTKEKQDYDGNMIKLYKAVASILKLSPGSPFGNK